MSLRPVLTAALMAAAGAAALADDSGTTDQEFLEYLGMEAESGWAEFFELVPPDPDIDAAGAAPAKTMEESHDEI